MRLEIGVIASIVGCSVVGFQNCSGFRARTVTQGEGTVPPEFTPLTNNGTTINLNTGRSYVWTGGTYLPAMNSRGTALVSAQELQIGGTTIVPSKVAVTESAEDHVVVAATGTAIGGSLSVSVITRVEYDGAALVTITLTPTSPVIVPSFSYVATVAHTSPYMTMSRYDLFEMFPATNQPAIRIQARARSFTSISLDKNFQNVVQFHDGQRSFSWFADNAKGWIWNNGAHVTQVTDNGSTIRFAQNIIGTTYTLSAPMTVSFGLMVTPVKSLTAPSWRVDLAPGAYTTDQGAKYGKNLVWGNIFCLETLPYVPCPPAILAATTPANAAKAATWTMDSLTAQLNDVVTHGLDALPYFSSMVTPVVDPDLIANRANWMVDQTPNPSTPIPWMPTWWEPTLPDPFESSFALPVSDYNEWRLTRLGAVLDKFGTPGLQGIYLDQHQVMDSVGPVAWVDSNGVTRPSLNIIGMREWLKGLKSLFIQRGSKGIIYAHDSGSEIAPMNSFATVTVDGEGFQGADLVPGNNDYALMKPEFWRTSYAGASETGVPVVVLLDKKLYDGLNCPPGNQPSADSRCYLTQAQVRQFFAQLLLLDGFFMNNYLETKQILDWIYPVFDVLQWLPYTADDTLFNGYWVGAAGAKCAAPCYASYYQRSDRAVVVVSNLSTNAGPMDVTVNDAALVGGTAVFTDGETGAAIIENAGHISVATGATNFKLIKVTRH